MTKLPANPTKQQEIDHLTAFVDALPTESYLFSILADTLSQTIADISNDHIIDRLAERRAEAARLTLDIEHKQYALAAEAENLRRAKQAVAATQAELDRLRKHARRIAEGDIAGV